MQYLELLTNELDTDKRLDTYLAQICEEMSRQKAKEFITAGYVLVNGRTKKPSYKLSSNLTIAFPFPEQTQQEILPENVPFNIIFEDNDLAIVYKPSGILTHPTVYERSGTLVNGLLQKYPNTLSDINGIERPGIVHRLDRDTSGLLLIAKNNPTHQALAVMLETKEIVRSYLAVVIGNVREDEGCIQEPIGRASNKVKMEVLPEGKEAMTFWKVLERLENKYTLIEATLATGRTHQIRVHMAYKGNPLVGDELYGGGHIKKVKLAGQALQSYKLRFIHPHTAQELSYQIPPDEKIVKCLKGFTNNNSTYLNTYHHGLSTSSCLQ